MSVEGGEKKLPQIRVRSCSIYFLKTGHKKHANLSHRWWIVNVHLVHTLNVIFEGSSIRDKSLARRSFCLNRPICGGDRELSKVICVQSVRYNAKDHSSVRRWGQLLASRSNSRFRQNGMSQFWASRSVARNAEFVELIALLPCQTSGE